MKPIIDIPNKSLPAAKRIREGLKKLSAKEKKEILEEMTEEEFIDYRVDVFLDQLEMALLSKAYSPAGAEEIAYHECMAGLENS